jgi:hypothetical protein
MIVTLIYDSEWEALAWAKKYCPSYITNEMNINGQGVSIDYYFGDEKDLILFKLRWE